MSFKLPSHHPHKAASFVRVNFHGSSILIGDLKIVTVGKEGTGLVLFNLTLYWSHCGMCGTSN